MKKLTMSMLAIFLMVVLAACGSDTNTPQPSSTEKPDGDVAVPEEEKRVEAKETKNVEKEEKSSDVNAATDDVRALYADGLTESIQYISEEQLELNQQSYDFIKSNSDIFPAETPDEVKTTKELAESIDYRLLSKNTNPYLSTITKFAGEVILISEENYEDGTATLAYIYDDNHNTHVVLLYKSAGDILDGDRVEFYGVPLGGYSYSADDGGFANALLYFGSHIEKN